MNWKYRHTMLVLVWAGLSLLGQLTQGSGGPAMLAGAIVGSVVAAALVVYVLGSCWQWAVRLLRG